MISEFERKKWEARDAGDQPVDMALRIAYDDLQKGDVYTKPVQVIVIVVEEMEGGGNRVTLNQSGSLSVLASEGAMHRAIQLSIGGQFGVDD